MRFCGRGFRDRFLLFVQSDQIRGGDFTTLGRWYEESIVRSGLSPGYKVLLIDHDPPNFEYIYSGAQRNAKMERSMRFGYTFLKRGSGW
jgi:hypothetical protein